MLWSESLVVFFSGADGYNFRVGVVIFWLEVKTFLH